MALLTDTVDVETVAAFAALYVLVKISSITGTSKFNIPHRLFNNRISIIVPSLQSLQALNYKPSKRKKNKDAPIVRPHKTVKDRIEALRYDVETVEQGMLMNFSCWKEFDCLIIFALAALIGFAVIEGWRAVGHQLAISVIAPGDCLTSAAQLSVKVASASHRQVNHMFSFFFLHVLSSSARIPHAYMYDKVKNWWLGCFFAFLLFMFIHTPALERYLDLPLSRLAQDSAVRAALLFRLVDSSRFTGDLQLIELGSTIIKVSMATYVAYVVAGFGHSLGQLSRVTAHILTSKGVASPSNKVRESTARCSLHLRTFAAQ